MRKMFLAVLCCFFASLSPIRAEASYMIVSIKFVENSYGYNPNLSDTENIDLAIADRENINNAEYFTVKRIYTSKQDEINNKVKRLRQSYDIEDVVKDGKAYWKCTPKNPLTITITERVGRAYVEDDTVYHVIENVKKEIPNPNYLSQDELKKRVIWLELNRIEFCGYEEWVLEQQNWLPKHFE